MIKRSLIPLLLFLGNITWIPSLKAQDSDSIICLTTKQVDFLILEQLDAQYLRKDTTYKGSRIKDLNRVILHKSRIIDNNDQALRLKDTIAENWRYSYNKLTDDYDKQRKSIKLFKSGTAIFGSATVILLCLLLVL